MKAHRWQRRKEERTPEILDAALACFAEKGFAATRMEDIAARAGITKGTIYLYFESKEAVFKALARSEIGARLAEVTQRMAGFQGSSADLLRLVLATMGTVARTSDARHPAQGDAGRSGTISRACRILAARDRRPGPCPVRNHHPPRHGAGRIPRPAPAACRHGCAWRRS